MTADGPVPSWPDGGADGEAPCFILVDAFDEPGVGPVWTREPTRGSAVIEVTTGRLGVAIGEDGGRAWLRSDASPPDCTASRIELRFRAAVDRPRGDGARISNEIKWPPRAGSNLNTFVIQFRYDQTGGSFVYQEQDSDASTTKTVARCAADTTARDYAIRIDFAQRNAPFEISCEGRVPVESVGLFPTHEARPFFVQAGVPFSPEGGASRIDIDSIEVRAYR